MTQLTIGNATLYRGDCIDVLRTLPDNSVDAIVTDPPYELGFMGKAWDSTGIAYNVDMWREALRVLKPGGYLLAFSGSRTYHRMAVAIEDAGFEVRDRIPYLSSPDTKYGALWDSLTDDQRGMLLEMLNDQIGLGSEMDWLYGSGFPKSMDVSKAIDKAAGAEREVLGTIDPRGTFDGRERASAAINANWRDAEGRADLRDLSKKEITVPATDAARQWEGWGTALKPAHEPICVARKPLAEKTVAANVLAYGTGGLNIDGCRVAPTGESRERIAEPSQDRRYTESGGTNFAAKPGVRGGDPDGRFPANLIHDGSPEVIAAFPEAPGQQGDLKETGRPRPSSGRFGDMAAPYAHKARQDADTSAARFFYCAKASRTDRNEGTEALPQKLGGMISNTSGQHITRCDEGYEAKPQGNHHPTVKPTDLMAYLARLVTPPGGTVLDMFMGSGSTGKAAMREGFAFIGIDRDADEHGNPLGYMDIAAARIAHEQARIAEQAARAAAAAAKLAEEQKPAPQMDLFAAA